MVMPPAFSFQARQQLRSPPDVSITETTLQWSFLKSWRLLVRARVNRLYFLGDVAARLISNLQWVFLYIPEFSFSFGLHILLVAPTRKALRDIVILTGPFTRTKLQPDSIFGTIFSLPNSTIRVTRHGRGSTSPGCVSGSRLGRRGSVRSCLSNWSSPNTLEHTGDSGNTCNNLVFISYQGFYFNLQNHLKQNCSLPKP